MNSEDAIPSSPEGDFDVAEAQTFGKTDRGLKRETNQDQFLVAELSKTMRVDHTSLALEKHLFGHGKGSILMVADGMGGHAGGQRASELAVYHLISELLDCVHWHFHGETDDEIFTDSLKRMLQDAHARILVEASQNDSIRGMGTTVTLAYIVFPMMYVVHAGDSRCYIVDRDEAKQLTNDHTLARRMVESGGMKEEEAATSRWSNVLYNVLGGSNDGDIIAELHKVELKPQQTVVLCSDGLHRYVDNRLMGQVIRRSDGPEQACEEFVRLALEGGGEDNVTAVVYQCPDSDLRQSTWIEEFNEQLTGGLSGETTSSDPLKETLPEVI